ncbi:hypothetical protein F0562_013075 [Nyssa sinensis]|uniref:Retrotransposon Copia-like N-terminal domain-containing protein n=1 Tax=Nyssa sinensis TaxID=561372 RepID=A0A5J4ZXD2_9ASTE|nr:hypothetical protein F0562_013075 [Nyssa sinensis]
MADVKKDEGSSGLDKKTFSPYTLNANDNPGNIITQVQLKGENYDEWARAMRTALRAKKKYGFIDGTVKQPADDSLELEDWWTVNSMPVSWIFNTIEPTLHSTISYMENVKDLWEDIRQRFSIGNGPRVQQLRPDLANCKQDGQAIITYYGRLKTLWDELNNYDQIPVCTCTGCRCNLTVELERKREEERVHQFLMGLDEEVYGTVRSNILSTEPLPNLNRVYAMVVQQERVQTMTRTRQERGSPMSFAVQAGGRNSGGDKDKTVVCCNCDREGHDADSCFQLIGYPEWWGNRSRATTTGRDSGRKRGTGGGRNKVGIAQANATQASGTDGGRSVVTDSDRKGLSGLNDEQWATLLGMLSSHKNGANERLTEFPYANENVTGAVLIENRGVNWSNDVENLENDIDEQHAQSTKREGEVNRDVEEIIATDANAGVGNEVEENVIQEEPLGRGQRVKQSSVRLKEYVTNSIKVYPPACSSLQSNSSGDWVETYVCTYLGLSVDENHGSVCVRKQRSAISGIEPNRDASTGLGIEGEDRFEAVLVENVSNLELVLVPTS